jgi:5-methylcytosine-specific restriction enzyme A
MTDKHPFSTRRGRKLRAAKLMQSPLCEPCRREGRITAATTVHHLVPLERGGERYPALDGLEALCDDHHKQVHGARPKPDIDPQTGIPRSGHWWCEA